MKCKANVKQKNRFELLAPFRPPSVTAYKQTTFVVLPIILEKPLRYTPHTQFTPEALKHNMPLVSLVRKWAERKNITPAQFALVWMLSRKSWIAPIPGTTNPNHLDDFLGAAHVRLTAYEMEEFDREYSQIDLMGHRADPFTESQIDK